MKYLDLTLSTPEENLALEEALLESCADGSGPEVLRLWEPASPVVVVGYANPVLTEVCRESCARLGIPILRRISGGGAVVQAPGALCYAVVLRTDRDPLLESIPGSNRYVLERVAQAVGGVAGRPVRAEGQTDLVIDGRKVAGNAQRRLGGALMLHGSLLVGMDLALMDRVLPLPSVQPAYRAGRTHGEFVANLEVSLTVLRQALREVWRADEALISWPADRTSALVEEKYSRPDWNFRR